MEEASTSEQARMSGSQRVDWQAVIAEAELDARVLHTIKRGRHQLVVGRDQTGEVFALDNRCPHEGYPLAQGKLDGCALTCTWHNWKFDVRNGDCTLGGEPVRSYPTRLLAGRVEVDLSEPDPSERIPALRQSLEQGLFDHDNGRAIRDGVRLIEAGYEPARLLADIAVYDARRAEYGSTHVLALAADCARVLPRFSGAAAMTPVAAVIDLCGETNRRLAERELVQPIDGATRAAFVAAVESEDAARAEGLLLGAFEGGLPLAQIDCWMHAVMCLHFTNFGHQLIYLVKLRELLDRAGESHARDLYVGLLRTTVLGTREDTLPYMRGIFEQFEPRWRELPRIRAAAKSSAAFDEIALRNAVLDGSGVQACESLWSALEAGVPAARIAEQLVVAAATRLFRFDLAVDRDPEVAETWLWATHRMTFASAVRNTIERWHEPDAMRFLVQCVAFVNSGKAMDAVPEDRLDPSPTDSNVAAVIGAIASKDAEQVVARVRGYLASDRPLAELRIAIEDLCLADPLVRPIVVTHAIKVAWAAFEEYRALERVADRELPLLAALRFLGSPIVERRVAATVETSIRWVVDGRIPRKLTQ